MLLVCRGGGTSCCIRERMATNVSLGEWSPEDSRELTQQHRGEHECCEISVCHCMVFSSVYNTNNLYKIIWCHRITGIIWPSKTRSKIDHTPLSLIQCIFLKRKMLRQLGLHGLELSLVGQYFPHNYKCNKQDLCTCVLDQKAHCRQLVSVKKIIYICLNKKTFPYQGSIFP